MRAKPMLIYFWGTNKINNVTYTDYQLGAITEPKKFIHLRRFLRIVAVEMEGARSESVSDLDSESLQLGYSPRQVLSEKTRSAVAATEHPCFSSRRAARMSFQTLMFGISSATFARIRTKGGMWYISKMREMPRGREISWSCAIHSDCDTADAV